MTDAATICTRTQTRTEACACGNCGGATSANDKFAANKRDALALLDLIAGCVENHPSQPHGDATWGHVGDIAQLRERLMAIATGFALQRNGDEQAARRSLEEALCVDDENVADALIDSM